eukprot:TRINITY_DN69229_c0_g1_i1.p1 TRINITY_DN69229_c0_g1~~TRINITY_DN69229_c0_g1_i1.p1  ORF type:complete len:219 (+),score=39.65 TRINITY_DN69229_c0_g1_i1:50-658(+)
MAWGSGDNGADLNPSVRLGQDVSRAVPAASSSFFSPYTSWYGGTTDQWMDKHGRAGGITAEEFLHMQRGIGQQEVTAGGGGNVWKQGASSPTNQTLSSTGMPIRSAMKGARDEWERHQDTTSDDFLKMHGRGHHQSQSAASSTQQWMSDGYSTSVTNSPEHHWTQFHKPTQTAQQNLPSAPQRSHQNRAENKKLYLHVEDVD